MKSQADCELENPIRWQSQIFDFILPSGSDEFVRYEFWQSAGMPLFFSELTAVTSLVDLKSFGGFGSSPGVFLRHSKTSQNT